MASLISELQYALSQRDPLLANETKRIVLREVLQSYALDFLYNHPTYRKLNFYGGTCLHILFNLNRLSEDIDLDNSEGISLSNLKDDLLRHFHQTVGYPEATAKTQIGEKGVFRITLKFPLLYSLGLSSHINEALHLKIEVSQHKQISMIRKTPVLINGRSFVAAHFSLETMMAGKMLACLERSFLHGKDGVNIKGRDFYDLLWFMQKQISPLEEKLLTDGTTSYTTLSAMQALKNKFAVIKRADLAVDLLSLFEQRTFIEAWLDSYQENFEEWVQFYFS
jgi:Nucleotidyl transferase AbiEii toxin, Type IV TA system